MNIVILSGYIGSDIKFMQTDKMMVSKFPLATTRVYKVDGHRKEETTWHNIVMFGKLAEIAKSHFKKGRRIGVQGRISVREYEKDGKQYMHEIVAEDFEFLDIKMKEGDDE